jgi:hypothetical protein
MEEALAKQEQRLEEALMNQEQHQAAMETVMAQVRLLAAMLLMLSWYCNMSKIGPWYCNVS